MNLYRITRNDSADYSEFVGLVVSAENEESAKNIAYSVQYNHPYGEECFAGAVNFNPDNIVVNLIGVTESHSDGEIILADFLEG